MRKDFFLLVLLLICIIPTFSFGVNDVVTFPDANLEQAVREAIDKPTGDIYESDLLDLTIFAPTSRGISDLTGIQHCVNLSALSIYDNNVTSINPLRELENLTALTLSYNPVEDYGPVSEISTLQTLFINFNMVEDITFLKNLPNLIELNLSNNFIRDITPLLNNGFLGNNTRINLLNNPLSYEAVNEDIPLLEARGVSVSYDDLTLSFNPPSLSFDSSTTTLTLEITNDTSNLITWKLFPEQEWITTIPDSGVTDNETDVVQVVIDHSKIPPGTGSGRILVESNRGRYMIDVNMVVEYLVYFNKWGNMWASASQGVPPFGAPEMIYSNNKIYDPTGDDPDSPDGANIMVRGDMDGDGMEDVVRFTPGNRLGIYLNKGNGFESEIWDHDGFRYKELDGNSYFTECGDFNGDGKDDPIQITEYGTAVVAISKGNKLDEAESWGTLGFYYNRNIGRLPLIEDFNGDFKDDLAVVTEFGDVWVALSEGDGFETPARWGWLGFRFLPESGYFVMAGDFNGDSKSDLVQFVPNSEVWVSVSDGDSFSTPEKWGAIGFSYNEDEGSLPITGDFNSDGKTDLLQVTPFGDHWITMSNGTSFDLPEYWGTTGFYWSRTDMALTMYLGY